MEEREREREVDRMLEATGGDNTKLAELAFKLYRGSNDNFCIKCKRPGTAITREKDGIIEMGYEHLDGSKDCIIRIPIE